MYVIDNFKGQEVRYNTLEELVITLSKDNCISLRYNNYARSFFLIVGSGSNQGCYLIRKIEGVER